MIYQKTIKDKNGNKRPYYDKQGREVWIARVDFPRKPDGSRDLQYRQAHSKKEAKEAEAKLIALRAEGLKPTPANITFKDKAEEYLNGYCKRRLKKSTQKRYREHLVHAIRYFGPVKLMNLTTKHIDSLYEYLREELKLSTQTVKLTHVQVNAVLKRCQEEGLIQRNPANMATIYTVENKTPGWLSFKELQTLLHILSNHRFYMIFLVAAHTGIRRAENMGLQVGDIDMNAWTLTVDRTYSERHGVDTPKTKSSYRMVPIPEQLRGPLAAHIEQLRDKYRILEKELGPNDWIYPRPDLCFPYGPDYVSHIFTELAKKAGHENITLHSLRHSFATNCLESGLDVTVVSKLLGHSSVKTTWDRYMHPSKGLLKAGMARYSEEYELRTANAEVLV